MEDTNRFTAGLSTQFVTLVSLTKFENVTGWKEEKMDMVKADSVGSLLISASAEATLAAARSSMHPPRRSTMGQAAARAPSPRTKSVVSSAYSSAAHWTGLAERQRGHRQRLHRWSAGSVGLVMLRKRRHCWRIVDRRLLRSDDMPRRRPQEQLLAESSGLT